MPPPGYEPFLATILDDPASDVARLVYADWLEEQGDPRAEFIRVQIEMAQLLDNDSRRESLSDRELRLLARHGDLWRAEIPEWARDPCEFVRGFVEEVHILGAWRAVYGPLLAVAAPVRKVTLQTVAGAVD